MSVKQTSKRIAQLAIFIGLVSLIYAEATDAYISESVIATGNKIVSGCWDNPTAPDITSPEDNYRSYSQTVDFSWKESSSSCETATLEYKLSIYQNKELTNEYYSSSYSTELTHNKKLDNGEYWWNISVSDQYNNTATSKALSLTIDQSQIVDNNWVTTGDVKIENGGLIQIGNENYTGDIGNYLWENRLLQSISPGAKTLSFDYNFNTTDDSFSDIPGFRVIVNGNTILTISASSGNVDWTNFSWDLSLFDQDKNINVEFQAGNTGDRINQSWVILRNISTSIKSSTSRASDIPLETTYEEGIGYQNIIINELSLREPTSRSDLELRNTTNTEIDLTGIKLTKFDGVSEVDMDITINQSINANGYLVINTDKLDQDNLQIRIYNKSDDLIDVAGDGGPAFAGIAADGEYYSMQRTIIAGEGTSALNWFTALSGTNPHNTLGEENY